MNIRIAVFEALDNATKNGDLVDAKEIAQDLALGDAVFKDVPVSEIELFVEEWIKAQRRGWTR